MPRQQEGLDLIAQLLLQLGVPLGAALLQRERGAKQAGKGFNSWHSCCSILASHLVLLTSSGP